MSKVFETEYDRMEEEDDNETIFYLKETEYKGAYIPDKIDKLGYFIDYFNMLKDNYSIGHKFTFYVHSTYTELLTMYIPCEPVYTDKTLDEPNCYFIKIKYYILGNHLRKNIAIDIHNNKIIVGFDIERELKYVFKNIFRE